MGVQIDKARRDDQPAGIDHLGALMRPDAADLGDASVFDSDVAAKTRRTGAVDDHAVFNHQIEFRHKLISFL